MKVFMNCVYHFLKTRHIRGDLENKILVTKKDRVSHSVASDSFATPWTVARQAPLSMEFSRQEHWSGLPFPFPGDHPDPGIKPRSPAFQGDSLPSEPLLIL